MGVPGAVEKTRTSTPCGTATSTLRVYHFRHDRTPGEPPRCRGAARQRVANAFPGLKRLSRIVTGWSGSAPPGLVGDLDGKAAILDADFAMGDERAIGVDA